MQNCQFNLSYIASFFYGTHHKRNFITDTNRRVLTVKTCARRSYKFDIFSCAPLAYYVNFSDVS